MAACRIHAVTSDGVHGHLAEVRAESQPGPPVITFSGVPATSQAQTRDRIRAAIINNGISWPDQRLTVRVTPAPPPGQHASLDLAIAVAVLTAAGHTHCPPPEGTALFGELGLDGGLRPVPARCPRSQQRRPRAWPT